MEKFFENPGLSHIGEKIWKNLHFKDKVTCRLVQKSWKNIFDNLASKVKLEDLIQILQNEFMTPIFLDKSALNNYFQNLNPDQYEPMYVHWSNFLQQIHSKIENPWISIYIKNIFMRLKAKNEELVSPLYTFAIFGNAKMVNFCMEQQDKDILKL